MTNNGTLKVLTCLFFVISCALLIWKKTPTGTVSETSTGTENETPKGHNLYKGDDINVAVIVSDDSGCFSSMATEEIESWASSYVKEDYHIYNDNLGGRQLQAFCGKYCDLPVQILIKMGCYQFCYGSDPEIFDDKPSEKLATHASPVVNLGHDLGGREPQSFCDHFCDIMPEWALNIIGCLEDCSPSDPEIFEDKPSEKLATHASLVVNLGHGYSNSETGIIFPPLESSDPGCDTNKVQLLIF